MKLISTIAAILVGTLAILAFILSYSSLQHMAENNGVEEWLSYLWPLLLDFAMIVFSLAILRANLRQEPARYPWGLTIIFATLATIANVLDVTTLGIPSQIIEASVKALAPVSLVLSFELLMSMVRAEIKRGSVVQSLAEMSAELDTITAKRDTLADTVAKLTGQIDDLKQRKRSLEADIATAKSGDVTDLTAAKQAKIEQRRADVMAMLQAGMDKNEVKEVAAKKWDVTPRTIGRDIKTLNGKDG